MALSTPGPRTRVTRRTIECAGYECADGLLDVEGWLRDLNDWPLDNPWRSVPPGHPVHEMHVRLRVDPTLVIQAVDVSMEATPYPYCQGAKPNLQRLVGLRITGGFKQQARKLIGHTEGCTHVLTLVENLATIAVRTLAGKTRDSETNRFAVFSARDPSRAPLIDTCYSYAASSPVVEKIFPEHYRPTDVHEVKTD